MFSKRLGKDLHATGVRLLCRAKPCHDAPPMHRLKAEAGGLPASEGFSRRWQSVGCTELNASRVDVVRVCGFIGHFIGMVDCRFELSRRGWRLCERSGSEAHRSA